MPHLHPYEHVSDLGFDRLLAGDLAPDTVARVVEHTDACRTCALRMHELIGFRARFHVPMPAPPNRRRPWRAVAMAGQAMTVAAIAILVVGGMLKWGRSADHGRGEESSERHKGALRPALMLAAGPAPELVVVATGDVVRPGDSLQASYSAVDDGHGAVLALDGAGVASTYVPSDGGTTMPLPAGVERSYPQSTVLDATTGRERVFVLWCASPRTLAPLLGELRATGDLAAPEDCHVRRIELAKREAR